MNLSTFMCGTFNLRSKSGSITTSKASGNAKQRRLQIRSWKRQGLEVFQWASHSGCIAAPITER